MIKKIAIRILLLCSAIAIFYGLGRLYFQLTGGFTIANITSDFTFQPQWETRELAENEKTELEKALKQPYRYLGKGCQSYVFISQDGEFVIKFFKYQRFRLQTWLDYFPPLPAVVKYKKEKRHHKWRKLDGFVQSWKIAFENLKDETGLVYVHLNKTNTLNKELTIYDKLGTQHTVNLDQMEFCVQHRADMLCDTLLTYKKNNDLKGAQEIIAKLFALIMSEYHRGFADNDHALMQNTGVVHGQPIHIDVGQFVQNEQIKEPAIYNQELFTKTYKFKNWVNEEYPELYPFIEEQLVLIMGPDYYQLQPKFRDKTKRML